MLDYTKKKWQDIKKVKEILLKVLEDNPKVLKDPAPAVFVSELAESSVNFVVRPWASSEDYWETTFCCWQDSTKT